MKKIIFFLLMAFTFVSAARAQFAHPDADAKYGTNLLKAGTKAPDFKLKTIKGKTLRLDKYRGKWVVLDFWASWCPDCRKDAPKVASMARKFGERGVQFIGISLDTDKEAWAKAVDKYSLDYPHVSELVKFKESPIAKAYGVNFIPTMYLIDPEGNVVTASVLIDKIQVKLLELFPDPAPTGSTKTDVSIDGDHGRLAGVVQMPTNMGNGKVPVVIQMHGFGGTKEGPLFEVMADTLACHGVATVRFDFNGHGKSEGAFVDMTVPNEISDAKKIYDYVRSQPWAGDIAFVGHSQGGVVASMTAGELGADRVKAVVLMAPAAVLRDDAIRGSTMGKTYNPLDPPEYVELWGGNRLGREYIKSAFRLPIYETAARYTGAAMIIHGTGDIVVPYTYGQRFHAQWPGSEYVELDAYDHLFSQNVYRTTDIAAKFLIKQLGGN